MNGLQKKIQKYLKKTTTYIKKKKTDNKYITKKKKGKYITKKKGKYITKKEKQKTDIKILLLIPLYFFLIHEIFSFDNIKLFFVFKAPSQADDIKDLQIEGMSIGDSALDFFPKSLIKNGTKKVTL